MSIPQQDESSADAHGRPGKDSKQRRTHDYLLNQNTCNTIETATGKTAVDGPDKRAPISVGAVLSQSTRSGTPWAHARATPLLELKHDDNSENFCLGNAKDKEAREDPPRATRRARHHVPPPRLPLNLVLTCDEHFFITALLGKAEKTTRLLRSRCPKRSAAAGWGQTNKQTRRPCVRSSARYSKLSRLLVAYSCTQSKSGRLLRPHNYCSRLGLIPLW